MSEFQTHRHRRNGLGARNENGLMVCGICGRGYEEDARRPTFVVDAKTREMTGVLVACPARVYGPFLGSDASYLSCSELDGHTGRHSFSVTWGPSQYAAPDDTNTPMQSGDSDARP